MFSNLKEKFKRYLYPYDRVSLFLLKTMVEKDKPLAMSDFYNHAKDIKKFIWYPTARTILRLIDLEKDGYVSTVIETEYSPNRFPRKIKRYKYSLTLRGRDLFINL